MINKNKLGFMQGRLSNVIRNKIQAFPTSSWKKEFFFGNKIGFTNMEWTIDNYDFHKNPIIKEDGYKEISHLCEKFSIKIPSITADFFMEDKYFEKERIKTYSKFHNFLEKCSKNKIKTIVLPLVDNSSISSNLDYLRILIEDFRSLKRVIKKLGLELAFETDLDPNQNSEFVKKLNSSVFGINYDIGNSVGYGFKYRQEINLLVKFIKNIHIKNKKKNKTCNLFLGEANVKSIVNFALKKGYNKNFIFQTARVKKNHYDIMKKYHKYFTY